MDELRSTRRRGTRWRAWAGSPIVRLCDDELALIAEHHRADTPSPVVRHRWRRR